jgi:hypothetical protein
VVEESRLLQGSQEEEREGDGRTGGERRGERKKREKKKREEAFSGTPLMTNFLPPGPFPLSPPHSNATFTNPSMDESTVEVRALKIQ